ncbi:MAG: iron-containing alcohol dehydrogenase, partial [Victivallales bacterium]|nr:iron-containing alcohol dehydrogenase [Victivallales bacterium]
MENFIYETPTKIYFGKDEELKIGKIIKEFHPKKVLLHYGGQSAQASGLLDQVRKCLADEGIAFVELGGVVANPELGLVRKGIELCKREGVDFVLAV